MQEPALARFRDHGEHPLGVRETDPADPTTLYSEGPGAAEPPDDDKPDASPLRDSGGTALGPDDLDWLT